jgi:hypothetical protein
MQSIFFPPNVKKIGDSAFELASASALNGNFDKIEELGIAPFGGIYLNINLFKNVKIYQKLHLFLCIL